MRLEKFSFRFEKRNKKEIEELEKINQEINLSLKKLSIILNNKGFFINEKCRIEPEKFLKLPQPLYSSKKIKYDQKWVFLRKKEFEKENQKARRQKDYEKIYQKISGNLVEKLKIISFNQFWFKNKFFSLRTSYYDDYRHQFDEIILDPKTPRVLGAIDVTLNWRNKLEEVSFKLKSPQKIVIDYGVLAEKTKKGLKIKYLELKEFPFFILSFRGDFNFLKKWFQSLQNKENKFLSSLLSQKIKELKDQCQVFSQITTSKKLKREYQSLYKFFSSIRT